LFLELFPEDESFTRRLRIVQRRVRHQGLPARALWLNGEQRTRLGAAVNQLVARRELKAPIVMGQLAPSFNKTPGDKQRNLVGTEVTAFDPLPPIAAGATWASGAHDAEGRARVVAAAVVADGTGEAEARMERALAPDVLL
jgi:urocanate hydratase